MDQWALRGELTKKYKTRKIAMREKRNEVNRERDIIVEIKSKTEQIICEVD